MKFRVFRFCCGFHYCWKHTTWFDAFFKAIVSLTLVKLIRKQNPSKFGDLTPITHLPFTENNLMETIPDTISKLLKQQIFSNYDNRLIGTNPSITSSNLTFLNLASNKSLDWRSTKEFFSVRETSLC